MSDLKYIEKSQRGMIIYKLSTVGFLRWPATLCNSLKIKVRPAGLEPATPCLEVRFKQMSENDEFLSNLDLLYSIIWQWLIEVCGKLLAFEALSSYKIIYSLFSSKHRHEAGGVHHTLHA